MTTAECQRKDYAGQKVSDPFCSLMDGTYSKTLDADVAYRPTNNLADVDLRLDSDDGNVAQAWFDFAYKYEPTSLSQDHGLARPPGYDPDPTAMVLKLTAGAFQRTWTI